MHVFRALLEFPLVAHKAIPKLVLPERSPAATPGMKRRGERRSPQGRMVFCPTEGRMPFGPTEISSGYCGQIRTCPAAAGSGRKTQERQCKSLLLPHPRRCNRQPREVAFLQLAPRSQQIHGHEDVAVIKERAPRPGHAINLHAMPCGGNSEPNRRALVGGKPRSYKTGPRYACFSYIRDWVEKKIRCHLARARQRQGFGR